MSEELGDLMWYVANVASSSGWSLDDVAVANLREDPWPLPVRSTPCHDSFDADLPEAERLPRRFEVQLIDRDDAVGRQRVRVVIDGEPFVADLTDNAYDPDGYRFHDVFHLAYAAVLAWSPVTRSLIRRKRKSRPLLDEVEDGCRAAVIEEGIAAWAFDYARRHRMLEGVGRLDFQLQRTVKDMTSHLEVSRRTTGEWEKAILLGFEVWRAVHRRRRRGRIAVDLDARRIDYLGPAEGSASLSRVVERDGTGDRHAAGVADA